MKTEKQSIISSRNFNKLKSRQPFTSRVKGLDQIGAKERRPSPFGKKGCPKGDSARAKRAPIWSFIKKIKKPVFTTSELAAISGKSLSATVQALNYLQKQGVVLKIYRGIWAEILPEPLSPYTLIPFLFPSRQVYVSFISALHLYGIIEQIPQVTTLASICHTKTITTKLGTFSLHQIAPSFFDGFDWYKQEGDFLIAEPEKALIDCLYLAGHKKKQFAHFPELHFPKTFSFKKAKEWVKKIPNSKVRVSAQKKLTMIQRKWLLE